MKVIVHTCNEFDKCYKNHLKTPGVAEAVKKFITHKQATPLEPFGAKDTHMLKEGPIGKSVSGIKHAHLTQDISVFYRLSGSGDSRNLHLYGIYSHKESGTGNSANLKIQASVGKKLSQQFNETISFDDYPIE